MAGREKIKVWILSGFLGAGKTTVLNHLLKKEDNGKHFVIENELGEMDVDSSLVENNYGAVFPLNDGCICCSLDAELYKILKKIVDEPTNYKRLFIEASGIADLGKLAAVFVQPEIAEYFDLQTAICVVDVETFEDRLTEVEEIKKQIVAADFVLLNKVEWVQESYLVYLRELIFKFNPLAKIVVFDDAFALDGIPHRNTTCFVGEASEGLKDNITEGLCKHNPLPISNPAHEIESVLYATTERFVLKDLESVLSVSLLIYCNQIYRVKGWVYLVNNTKPFLVQSTGNRLQITEYKGDCPQHTQLVFIGKNINLKSIQRVLKGSIYKV